MNDLDFGRINSMREIVVDDPNPFLFGFIENIVVDCRRSKTRTRKQC